MRLTTMWITHALFVLETGGWTLVSLAMDPDARRHPMQVLRGFWRLRKSPFTSKRAVSQLMQYTHRGFHPNDRDTTTLIADWRARLFGADGADGTLSELLAS